MTKFEWKSEEDWIDNQGELTSRRVWSWKRILAWFTLISIVLASTAGVLNRRLDQAEKALTAEILSSRELLRTALANRDRELFVSVLSGRSGEWVNTQLARFKREEIDGFRPMGLVLENGEQTGGSYEVELEPDLLGAELQAVERYQDRFGRSFSLQKTEIYRQGQSRWLFAPPESEFWGDWQSFVEPGSWLDVRFPERDAAAVWPIKAYIEEKIGDLCHLPVYRCPADLKIDLIFHSDPYSLIEWSDRDYRLTRDRNIVVPSPSLIGIPLDQTGREALQRAYAALVLPKLIVSLIDYDCCRGRRELVEALIERQMVQLGVVPDPLIDLDIAIYFDNPFLLNGDYEPGGDPETVKKNQQRASIEAYFWISFLSRDAGPLLLDLADGSDSGWAGSLTQSELQQEFINFIHKNLAPENAEFHATDFNRVAEGRQIGKLAVGFLE